MLHVIEAVGADLAPALESTTVAVHVVALPGAFGSGAHVAVTTDARFATVMVKVCWEGVPTPLAARMVTL